MSLGSPVNLADTGDADDVLPTGRVLAVLVAPLASLVYTVAFPLLLPVLLFRGAFREVLRRRRASQTERAATATAQHRSTPLSLEPVTRSRPPPRRQGSRPPRPARGVRTARVAGGRRQHVKL